MASARSTIEEQLLLALTKTQRNESRQLQTRVGHAHVKVR